jgi:hypothetical protein
MKNFNKHQKPVKRFEIGQEVVVRNGMYDYEKTWALNNGYSAGSGKFLNTDSNGKIVSRVMDSGAEYFVVNVENMLLLVNRARLQSK